jgi:isoquinoline 1-oxidoreductase beta subunit
MKLNGGAIFGLDKKIPGMLCLLPWKKPRLHLEEVKSFDDSKQKKIPGIKKNIFVVKWWYTIPGKV